jgi:secondary thiamine-phosphate synthase enzyme
MTSAACTPITRDCAQSPVAGGRASKLRQAFHESISRYRHNRTGEDNGDAHLKRQVMGREVVVAVTDGRLDFGPWEQIFYGEFDGRRRKRVLVKIIGE